MLLVPIRDISLANGIFVKEGVYKAAADSLKSLVYVYKDKVAVKEAQVEILKENVESYKMVSDLCEKERASLKTALDDEKKAFKKYRTKSTVVGVLGAILLAITTTLWLVN